jgi:hypothetical protein
VNVVELLNEVRRHGADVSVDGDRLVVRGRGEPLPTDLQRALQQHKPEVLAALGVPINRISAEILRDLRPHLAPALRRLDDHQLLILVNCSILRAFDVAAMKASPGAAR